MSGVGRPPGATLGKARLCPHCKATVLESASVCPGCRHHLRFESAAAPRDETAFTAWKVDGIIGPRTAEEACEYSVVIALRNEDGKEIARHVVAVGALQPHERRSFSLSVELISPRPALAALRQEATPIPAKPVSSAPNRAPPAPPPPPGATVRPATRTAGFVEPRLPVGMPPRSLPSAGGRIPALPPPPGAAPAPGPGAAGGVPAAPRPTSSKGEPKPQPK